MQQLLKLLELNRKLDPFYKEKESGELFSWLLGEIKEAEDEYKKGDFAGLEGEMGDVLWNLFMLLDKLEDEQKISKQKVFEKITDKISKRKSFLLENREVSKNEAKKYGIMLKEKNDIKKKGYGMINFDLKKKRLFI